MQQKLFFKGNLVNFEVWEILTAMSFSLFHIKPYVQCIAKQ